MNAETDDTISMSFVDVITNGMGSMLVLFLLMTVLRQAADLGAPHAAGPDEAAKARGGEQGRGVEQPPEKDPFVVLVTARDGRPLRRGGELYQWDHPAGTGAKPNGGASFAALYATKPPPAGAKVELAGVRAGAEVTIQVWRNGTAAPRRTETASDSGTVAVWPEPEARP